MNYIDQINGFWERCETAKISGIEISVYMALLNYCNRLNWKNPFICHWDILCQNAKISKNTYYKSIEVLEKEGFLTYEKGQKNTAIKPTIFILEFKNNKGIEREQKRNNKGTEEEQQGNLDKPINIETYKQLFENFRKQYQGKKLGLEKEFENFKKKHKDWKEVIDKLENALLAEITWRKNKVGFVPEWKNLQTWLNQRCWEQEFEATPPPKKELVEIPASFIFNNVKIDYGNND